MPLRELLLCAAVPVSAEQERSAAHQRHVHHVLRGDGVLRRVFGHVAASCRDVGTLTSEDELLPAASLHVRGRQSGALPDLIPASDSWSAAAPDVTPDITPDVTSSPAAPPPLPPPSDLHWALQLVFTHFRHGPPPPPPPPRKGRRATRSDPARGRGARPRDKPGSGGGAGGGGGGGGGDRAGSVSVTLRHVGEELRRIADQLQLNRLVGWPTQEEILRDVLERHPVLSGLAGCALVAAVTAALSRALRQ